MHYFLKRLCGINIVLCCVVEFGVKSWVQLAREVVEVPEVYFHSLSPGLLKDPGSDAWVNVLILDCKYSFEPQAIPCSITWRRNMPNAPSTPDGPKVKTEEEKEVLVFLEPEDFLKRLFSLTQVIQALSQTRQVLYSRVTLPGEQGRRQALSPGKQSHSSQPGPELAMIQEEITGGLRRVRASGSRLAHLSLSLSRWSASYMFHLCCFSSRCWWGNIEVLFLDTWQEFVHHVPALRKAMAKHLYKRQLGSQEVPFRTAEAWASGVRVEKDSTGLRQVWKGQLQQFNRVSPATAVAVAEAYPSPSLLLQAEKCSTEDENVLLSDIPVKSDVSREDCRVGPDLSCCIYLFMVSTAPDLILDLSTQRDRGPCPSAASFYLPRLGNGSCCWHGQRCWEPGQGKQLILLQNRNLHINKCLVTDAFFSLLASLSFFSCPSFLSPWLESWLLPRRAGEWLEEGLDVTVLVSCP
ncbi:LOW QUALITY PROTEIN: putative crossover junction endonuclease EME2 [Alca torda]